MYARVLTQVRALPEGPPAIHTIIGLLVGVDPHVLTQMALLAEPLSAIRACVGSRIRVNSLVLLQRRFLAERTATGVAFEEAQIFGCPHVCVLRDQVGHIKREFALRSCRSGELCGVDWAEHNTCKHT